MKPKSFKKIRRRTDLALAAATLYKEHTGKVISTTKVYHTYTNDEDEYEVHANALWVLDRILEDEAARAATL